MNDHAARTPEFGTGLRARLEEADRVRDRTLTPSSRDLVRLLAEDRTEGSQAELVLVGDLPRHRAPGPVAA